MSTRMNQQFEGTRKLIEVVIDCMEKERSIDGSALIDRSALVDRFLLFDRSLNPIAIIRLSFPFFMQCNCYNILLCYSQYSLSHFDIVLFGSLMMR